ncbi:MAG: outer membrane protein assembly factor BamD, partial [Polaribacter sp.]|nr:outer membrane protein assembly factor BamD [Polaribacter sp.]
YKLQKKYFEIAKTYYTTADYDMRNYKAAIQAFDNLLEDYLGSEFKEEALYYRLKAAHDFTLKSYDRRKPERIKDAMEAYEKLIRNYPETKFKTEVDKMIAKLQKEKERIDDLIAKSKELEDSK